jgi:hypothetical protein
MNYFTPATGTVRPIADAWVPAALSVAYDRGACGKALLEAVIAGALAEKDRVPQIYAITSSPGSTAVMNL